MHEIHNTKQDEHNHTRWFQDANWDLTVWYDDGESIMQFELAYDKGRSEKALVWKRSGTTSHQEVATGDETPGTARTPVLGESVSLDANRILTRFREDAAGIDRPVFDLVAGVLADLAGRQAANENPGKDAPAVVDGASSAEAADTSQQKLRYDPGTGRFTLE